jgi:hypothetical protein
LAESPDAFFPVHLNWHYLYYGLLLGLKLEAYLLPLNCKSRPMELAIIFVIIAILEI